MIVNACNAKMLVVCWMTLFATSVLSAEEGEDLLKIWHRENCLKSTGATPQDIEAVINQPTRDTPRTVKCYTKCLMEITGVEKDGVFQKDVAIEKKPATVTVDDIERMNKNCAGFTEPDSCDAAFTRYLCYNMESENKTKIFRYLESTFEASKPREDEANKLQR